MRDHAFSGRRPGRAAEKLASDTELWNAKSAPKEIRINYQNIRAKFSNLESGTSTHQLVCIMRSKML